MRTPEPGPQKQHTSSELVGDVIQDARELASAEVDRLRGQAREVGHVAKIAGAGAGVLVIAGVMLAQALGFALVTLGMRPWLAFALIALAAGAAGAGVLLRARRAAQGATSAA